MNKLLLALMIENGDAVSLKQIEIMLDNLVNAHDVYPTFKEEQVTWNVEDHAKQNHEPFVKTLNNMSKSNDLINICFSPKCEGCGNHLHKVSVTNMKFVFGCNECSVEYVFEVVHSGNPYGSQLDAETTRTSL